MSQEEGRKTEGSRIPIDLVKMSYTHKLINLTFIVNFLSFKSKLQ